MNTPKTIISTLLPGLVVIISIVCLACYAAGHPEWTAMIGSAHMAFPTALCFLALAFSIMLQRHDRR